MFRNDSRVSSGWHRDLASTTMLVTGLLFVLLGSARAGSLRYDQTQTGDTNIHLQIKNVEVLALLDDSAGAEVSREGCRGSGLEVVRRSPGEGRVSREWWYLVYEDEGCWLIRTRIRGRRKYHGDVEVLERGTRNKLMVFGT